MTYPLAIIRPQPGNDATAAQARALGWDVMAVPLFAVAPVAWDLPDIRYDALLLGSANTLRHGGEALDRLRHLPVYAVGERTAEQARHHGFTVAHSGKGGLAKLLPVLETHHRGAPLWLSGQDVVPLPLQGPAVTRIAVYDSAALPMPAAMAEILQNPAIILLHSARAAMHLRAECTAAGIDISQLSLACFGPRVVAAAGTGWAACGVADAHNDKALLETARRLCKKLLQGYSSRSI